MTSTLKLIGLVGYNPSWVTKAQFQAISGKKLSMIAIHFNQSTRNGPRRKRPPISSFLKMCEQVLQFLHENNSQQIDVFVARNGSAVDLYLVTKQDQYDFSLSRKFTDFMAPYIDQGLITSSRLLPASSPEELESYFDPKAAIRIEGHNA